MEAREILYQTRRFIVLAERRKTWQQRIVDRQATVNRLNAIMKDLSFLQIAGIRRCDPRIYFA